MANITKTGLTENYLRVLILKRNLGVGKERLYLKARTSKIIHCQIKLPEIYNLPSTVSKINKITLTPLTNQYVEPIMLYGCETWTLLKKDKKKLESTEMWFMRRMLKVKWTEKVTNDEVLRRMNNKRQT